MIDEAWTHNGHNAALFLRDGKVIKKFKAKEAYEHEKKYYELLKGFTPDAEFNDETLEIMMEKCIPLLDWIGNHNFHEKKVMAKKILNLIKHLHYRKISHNDFQANNIVIELSHIRDCNPRLIDFENSSKITNKINWWETNDFTGEKYLGFDSDHSLSLKLVLGFSAKELIGEVRERDLLDELINISSDTFDAKDGKGLYYGSYHHPKFTHLNAQRNSLERFNLLNINFKTLNNKKVLDIGCNCGAMSLMAFMKGAYEIIGLDGDKRYIDFCIHLFKFLNYASSFEVVDINKLNVLPDANIIFAFNISTLINKSHLIKLLNESKAELIYFEDNSPDKDKGLHIPNYECILIDSLDGRLNYTCKRRGTVRVTNIG